jgi:putative ABC transport system substrate-binding protein
MNRRDFLLLAAGTAMASKPVLAVDRVPRIGLIGPGSRDASQSLFDAFRDGLVGFGWTDGGNLAILDRWAEERSERLPGIARELIGSGVDMLVTVGTPATLAARSATATMPLVLVGVGDPVGLGIVNSLARPGGNATGLSLSSVELSVKRLQLLQELLPGLGRVAVIIRNDPGLEQRLLDIRRSANRMGLEVVDFVVTTGRAVELAFMWLRSDRCDAIYLASGPRAPPNALRSSRWPRNIAFPRSTLSGYLPPLAACCPSQRTRTTCSAAPRYSSTGSSRAPFRPTCRSKNRPSSGWSSIVKRRRHLGSSYRNHSLRVPTR